jgi:hypothetical protein
VALGGLVLAASQMAATPTFSTGVVVGVLSSTALNEVSGIVASRVNPHVLWCHNDKGDSARIFAISDTGQLLGTYAVPITAMIDFEDIATGPGTESHVTYLYIGDIGDNAAARPYVTVYRAPEPLVYVSYSNAPVARSLTNVAALRCYYPGGPRNAESLLLDPLTTNVYIASKTSPTTMLYCVTADAFAHGVCTMTLARTLTAITTATAGDISVRGDLIFLRSKAEARAWQREAGERVEDALGRSPLTLPLQTEPQGEAIAADAQGNDYFTTSEGLLPPLYRYYRTSSDGVPQPQTLMAAGTAWRWHAADGGTDGAWRLPEYDDSAWNSGAAPFGAGYDVVATTVTAPVVYAWTTVWYRSACAPPPQWCTAACLRVACADGIAVYVNGSEIARINLAGSAPADALALECLGARAGTWRSLAVAPQLLRGSTCMIAAEVHHAAGAAGFSASLFDMQLEGVPALPETGAGALVVAGAWLWRRIADPRRDGTRAQA